MLKKTDETKTTKTTAETSPQIDKEFSESGWTHYSKKEYYRAEEDFQKALEKDPANIDALYGLGMTYQASNRKSEAIHSFEKVLFYIEGSAEINKARALMLTRLARGHINRINTGDWSLEP